jgi:hypothetical protein
MKFHANVVFELKADSIAEAGQKLDRLLKLAQDHHDLAAKAVELRVPPADALTAPSVILPPVTVPTRAPGPQAESLSHSIDQLSSAA